MNSKRAKALRRIARELSDPAAEGQTSDRRYGRMVPMVQRTHVRNSFRKNYKQIKKVAKANT